MNKTLSILIALIMVPCAALAGEQAAQQTDLSRLLDQYEVQQKTAQASVANGSDPGAEIRRLRNQMIDLRVERDALQDENVYLKDQLKELTSHESEHPVCSEAECVPISDVENERILSYVIYSLSIYRTAEMAANAIPQENVEAHRQAQIIMAGVKSDLDVLGFDTTNMEDYPTLDELLEQFKIASGSRSTR